MYLGSTRTIFTIVQLVCTIVQIKRSLNCGLSITPDNSGDAPEFIRAFQFVNFQVSEILTANAC